MITEIVVGFLFAMFLQRLIVSQDTYAKEFNANQIAMQDFTIRVRNLPFDVQFGKDPHVLEALLIAHFQGIIRQQFTLENNGTEPTEEEMREISEVIDVCFADPSLKDIAITLSKMQDLRDEYI